MYKKTSSIAGEHLEPHLPASCRRGLRRMTKTIPWRLENSRRFSTLLRPNQFFQPPNWPWKLSSRHRISLNFQSRPPNHRMKLLSFILRQSSALDWPKTRADWRAVNVTRQKADRVEKSAQRLSYMGHRRIRWLLPSCFLWLHKRLRFHSNWRASW